MNAPLPPHGMLGGCLAAGGSGVSADLHLLLGMNRRTFVDSRGGGQWNQPSDLKLRHLRGPKKCDHHSH